MPINLSEEYPKISHFLTNHHIGVLATVDADGLPHAATMYFSVDSELNFYFITKQGTIKSKNLQNNPKAALAVYGASTQSTVQVRGDAIKIEDESRIQQIFGRILAISQKTSESAVPPASRLVSGEYVAFCLKPSVIRMAEYTKPLHADFSDIFETVVEPGSVL